MAFRVWGLGFRVWGLGFRVSGSLGLPKPRSDPTHPEAYASNPALQRWKASLLLDLGFPHNSEGTFPKPMQPRTDEP